MVSDEHLDGLGCADRRDAIHAHTDRRLVIVNVRGYLAQRATGLDGIRVREQPHACLVLSAAQDDRRDLGLQ